ncbi:MAG: hypothetical protein ACRDZX_02160 [Acidimicrobiales bacterium]
MSAGLALGIKVVTGSYEAVLLGPEGAQVSAGSACVRLREPRPG